MNILLGINRLAMNNHYIHDSTNQIRAYSIGFMFVVGVEKNIVTFSFVENGRHSYDRVNMAFNIVQARVASPIWYREVFC